jgi:hypothetical protein
MRRASSLAVAAALAAASPWVSDLAAQTLGSRVAAVRDGTVQLAFPARPGVCGDGHGSVFTMRGDDRWYGNTRSACVTGPVRVSIGKADGQIVSVRSCVACRPRTASTPDFNLGEVSPAEGARYLLDVAKSLGGSNASEAVSAAAFADGGDLSPELIRLARDDDATTPARKDALFWLGQSEVRSQELVSVYASLKPHTLREHFTFVLSQRRDDDVALDKLIDIAQHDADFKVRKQAMFWLGQSKDPKAIKFFQTILMR